MRARLYGAALDKRSSWMVGDQTRDIEMARRAGLRSVLLRTGVGGADGKFAAEPDFIADDLAVAAEIILRDRAARGGSRGTWQRR